MCQWGLFEDRNVIKYDPHLASDLKYTYHPTDVVFDVNKHNDGARHDVNLFIKPTKNEVSTILFYGIVLFYHNRKGFYDPIESYRGNFNIVYHDPTQEVFLYEYMYSREWSPRTSVQTTSNTGVYSYPYPY
jgi:hypothetical protein